LAETEVNMVLNRADARCQFAGHDWILGWSQPNDRGSPMEHALVGYGRPAIEPLAGHSGGHSLCSTTEIAAVHTAGRQSRFDNRQQPSILSGYSKGENQ
jgi:hypothetical protein